MNRRRRTDHWNGVADVRRVSDASRAEPGRDFVAFFVVADSREDAANGLFAALCVKEWELVSFVNFQSARDVDDEAAGHLHDFEIDAEAHGISLGNLPDERARLQ